MQKIMTNSCTIETVTLGFGLKWLNTSMWLWWHKQKLNEHNKYTHGTHEHWKYERTSVYTAQMYTHFKRMRGKEAKKKRASPSNAAFTDLFAHKYYMKWHIARIQVIWKIMGKYVEGIDER